MSTFIRILNDPMIRWRVGQTGVMLAFAWEAFHGNDITIHAALVYLIIMFEPMYEKIMTGDYT